MPHWKRALLLWVLTGSTLAAPAGLTASDEDDGSTTRTARAAQAAVTLTRWTVDAGGTTQVSGASFTLAATIGQPEAALVGAANYALSAGFWAPRASEPSGDAIFANGFEHP